MGIIQFIQITPDELQKAILDGVKSRLDELKKAFQPKEPPKFLTRLDVANLLQINLGTVDNWRKKGILTAYQIGGRVYFKYKDIEDAMVELKG